MQCPYCGANLKPEARFCSQCGADVVQADPIPEAFPYAEPSLPAAPPEPAADEPAIRPQSFSVSDIPNVTAVPAAQNDRSGLAIASLVLGVISLCFTIVPICSVPMVIIGVVLGFMSTKTSKRGLAIAGIVLNLVALLSSILWIIFVGAMGLLSIAFPSTQ